MRGVFLPLILSVSSLLLLSSCADKSSNGSSLISGNSTGNFSVRGKSDGIGSLEDELAKFDAKRDQGTLEPTIVEENVDDDSGDSDIIAVTQLDQQAFGTVRLPDGYECTGQGGFISDSADIVILSQDRDNCTARITFADGAVDPEGRVFFAGTVRNSNGDQVTLNYELTISESDNTIEGLIDTDPDDLNLPFVLEDILIDSERTMIGDINAVGDGNTGEHYFMFPSDIDPTNVVFQYSIPEGFDASQLTDVDHEEVASVQQNRAFYGEAHHIDELEEQNSPFLIEEVNYETNKIRFRLKFKPLAGFPGRYYLDGLQGIRVPRGKALLVLEVKHSGTIQATGQLMTVTQQFRLKVDFLGQPEPDLQSLVKMEERPGATTQYFRTAGRVSATRGFEIAREVQAQLASEFGEGVNFYAVQMNDAAENQWVFGQILNLIWLGSVDINEEGQWKSRREIPGGSLTNYEEAPLPYKSWLPGEPNNRGGEHCAHMRWHFNSSAWNDWHCSGQGFMVFELELTDEFSNGDGDGPFEILQ